MTDTTWWQEVLIALPAIIGFVVPALGCKDLWRALGAAHGRRENPDAAWFQQRLEEQRGKQRLVE